MVKGRNVKWLLTGYFSWAISWILLPFLFYSEKIPVVHEEIIIDKECAERLNVGNWINDNIIGLYCKLLKERQTRTPHKFKKCHFASSFYYTKVSRFRLFLDGIPLIFYQFLFLISLMCRFGRIRVFVDGKPLIF